MANGEVLSIAKKRAIPSEILEEDDPAVRPPSWLHRRFTELGVITDMSEPTRPTGITLNYSTVLFYLAVLGFIAGGFWWTWQRGEESGRVKERVVVEKEFQAKEQDREAKERQALLDRLAAAEKEARDAKNIASAKK